MKILAISDEESRYYWDCYKDGMFNEYDLIISCGDLNPHYIEFIATYAHCPVLYVNGNHDGKEGAHIPEGCICIEDRIYNYNGVRIMGLGGSMKYGKGPNQYTQGEMNWRLRRLKFSLMFNRGIDILVTHAPAYKINDREDIPHRGFSAFNQIIERYKPKYFIHGHIHMNYGKVPRVTKHNETTIINAYQKYIFEY